MLPPTLSLASVTSTLLTATPCLHNNNSNFPNSSPWNRSQLLVRGPHKRLQKTHNNTNYLMTISIPKPWEEHVLQHIVDKSQEETPSATLFYVLQVIRYPVAKACAVQRPEIPPPTTTQSYCSLGPVVSTAAGGATVACFANTETETELPRPLLLACWFNLWPPLCNNSSDVCTLCCCCGCCTALLPPVVVVAVVVAAAILVHTFKGLVR